MAGYEFFEQTYEPSPPALVHLTKDGQAAYGAAMALAVVEAQRAELKAAEGGVPGAADEGPQAVGAVAVGGDERPAVACALCGSWTRTDSLPDGTTETTHRGPTTLADPLKTAATVLA
jgi:hypothetical protein